METPFKNDPYAIVYHAFKGLYPDKPCEIWWEPDPSDNSDEAYGETRFPDDGGIPVVYVYANYPVNQQVEILAHELAHVAVGSEHDHDEAWETAFDAIQDEYDRIGNAMFGGTEE